MIWAQVCTYIEDGNGVIAWTAPTDAGFAFDTVGRSRRVPVDLDGFSLVAMMPEPEDTRPRTDMRLAQKRR
jgi:CRISPR-associated protein Cas2